MTCSAKGYHLSHHLKPSCHFTALPQAHRQEALLAQGAVIFDGVSGVDVWVALLGNRLDRLRCIWSNPALMRRRNWHGCRLAWSLPELWNTQWTPALSRSEETMDHDVLIVGGGPAGLSTAIFAAMRGLSCAVFEQQHMMPDKPCGEGLMPHAARCLERMGARSYLTDEDLTPFMGVRFYEGDGDDFAEASMGHGPALGIRRTGLVRALTRRALHLGVTIHQRCPVRTHDRVQNGVAVQTPLGTFRGRLLVGADGLRSQVRRREQLDGRPRGPRRYGLRAHYQVEGWHPFLEVHFGEDCQVYIAPVGWNRICVTLLWDLHRPSGKIGMTELLSRFPALADRLRGAPMLTRPWGCGPMECSPRKQIADRVVLVGDAAGFVDAITGDGIITSMQTAEALGALLPQMLSHGASERALMPYQKAWYRVTRHYERVTRGLVFLARHGALRRALLWHPMRAMPWCFGAALNWMGENGYQPPVPPPRMLGWRPPRLSSAALSPHQPETQPHGSVL